MRRGRLIIFLVLGFLVLISLGGVAFLFVLGGKGGTPVPTGAAGPTPLPVIEVTPTSEVVMILAAGQTLERGIVVPTEAIISIPWPKNILPFSAVTDTTKIVGYRARITIARGEPIFDTMVLKGLGTPDNPLSPAGSDAALQIPAGLVAISLPYDPPNGVALALKDGDHISVIASWRIVDVDEEFQSVLPNDQGSYKITDPTTQAVLEISGSGPVGRLDLTTTGEAIPNYLIPHETQRFRLVTQVIIKDALILHMGTFGENKPLVVLPTDTPVPNGTPPTAVPASPTPVPPGILTLVVSPQDALAINYVNRVAEKYPDGIQLTLVLRSTGDTTLVDTQSVTQQYMFENFDIQIPTKLDYGVWGTSVPPTALPARP